MSLLRVFGLVLLVFTIAASAFPQTSSSTSVDTPETFGKAITPQGEFDGSYVCETSSGSPHSADINRAAETLGKIPGKRCRHAGMGTRGCTELVRDGDAAFGICGYDGAELKCSQVQWAARWIAKRCDQQGRAGGKYWFTEAQGMEILIYHR